MTSSLRQLTLTSVLLVAVALTAFVACGSNDDPSPAPGTPTPAPVLSVVTTIYPVTYFSERIGGDRISVKSLITPGVEAHDFEPTPGDIRDISRADVLVYVDPNFEGWIEGAVESAGNAALIVVKTADLPEGEGDGDEKAHDEEEEKELLDGVRHVIEEVEDGEITAAEGIQEIEALLGSHGGEVSNEDHVEELEHEISELVAQTENGQLSAADGIELIEIVIGGHAHEEGDGHDHGGADPHVWLNPIEAMEQVRAIQAAFSEADSAGADIYRFNANTLVTELLELDSELADALASCSLDHIVVSHEAYGHMASRYGIEQIGLADLSAESESTPQRIADVIKEMNARGITHILQEPILSDSLANTVASETDAELLPLHPLESLTSTQADAGETYFSFMRQNLESLKTAMRCE